VLIAQTVFLLECRHTDQQSFSMHWPPGPESHKVKVTQLSNASMGMHNMIA